MKAAEYYEKYRDTMFNNDDDKIRLDSGLKFSFELKNELVALADKRNAKTNDEFMSVLKEINSKANAVFAIASKNKDKYNLNRDTFVEFLDVLLADDYDKSPSKYIYGQIKAGDLQRAFKESKIRR